jgi:hypothetical protein
MSEESKGQGVDDEQSPPSDELAEQELGEISGGNGTGAIIPHLPPTPGG